MSYYNCYCYQQNIKQNPKQGRWIRILAVFVFTLFIRNSASANTTFAGNIKIIEGETPAEYVKIVRPGFTKILSGKPNDALFEGDTIKTGNGVKVQLELSDQTLISLAPNSNIQLKGYMAVKTESRRNSVLRLLKGTARFIVAKLFRVNGNGERPWSHTSVTIETINAVAGVRGTDLFVSSEGNETEVAVLEGAVAVKSTDIRFYGEVYLGQNQVSRTQWGNAAGEATQLPEERKELLLKMTTVSMNSASQRGEDAGKKHLKLKYDKNAIARDLAAGIHLSKIIDSAVESGMPLEEVIPALMESGALPAVVIYTCIQEGFPVSKIVETAILAGTPADTVVTASLSAGADQQLIIVGLQMANISSADIALLLANASAIDYMSLSGAESGSPTPSSVLPDAPLSIGGSAGGGTPSASRYKP